MRFTIEDVLQLETLGQAKLLTQKSTLAERPVEWVSVIEMPVENFVRPHEFVLTTAIGCGHDVALFKHFVQEVIESEAAGLGVATGRHIDTIPQEVIQLAEEERFPLVEIPWEVRFADVTEDLFHKLNHWQHRIVQDVVDIQQDLLHCFLRRADFHTLTEIIAQHLNNPVLIIDTRGMVRGESKQARSLRNKWTRYAEREQISLMNDFPTPVHPHMYTEVRQLELEKDLIFQVSIRSASEEHGYLLFELADHEEVESYFSKEKMQLLEHITTAVALWFLRENSIQETELRLKGDFVWRLAKGELEEDEGIYAQAKTFGYHLHLPYTCIIGYPENLDDLIEKEVDLGAYEHQFHQMVRHIEESFAYAGRKVQREVMTTYQRNEFVTFLEYSPSQKSYTIFRYLDEVDQQLKEHFPRLIMSWGIGESQAGVRQFTESFQNARVALNIGRKQKGIGKRYTYADTDLYRALVPIAQNEEMKALTLSIIGSLAEYERNKGIDLIHTLMTYIRFRGNVSQTARRLHLHRQSLLYRLKKIESLTERALEDPDDLFLLDLSLKMWMTGMIEE